MNPFNRDLAPTGANVLFEASEGPLRTAVLRDPKSGVCVASFAGHQDDPYWSDQSNCLRAWCETLDFLEDLNPTELVWDLSSLHSMESLGLTSLQASHAKLTRNGYRSIMVANVNLKPMIVWLRLTFYFDAAVSVREAMDRLADSTRAA